MTAIAFAAISYFAALAASDSIGSAHAFVGGGAQIARKTTPLSFDPPAAAVAPGRCESQLFSAPSTEFTLMWEAFKQQLFYSRMAYAYDYFLDGKDGKKAESIGKSIADILKETQPLIQQKFNQVSNLSEKEKKQLKGKEASILANKTFMQYVLSMATDYAGADENYLVAYRNDNQNDQCVWGIWRDDSAKRIQIFLRGTETSRKTADVSVDADFRLSEMKVPPVLNDIINANAELNEDSPLVKRGQAIKSLSVHKGFHDYVFANKDIEPGVEDQAIKQIMDLITEIDQDPKNENYEIRVTGHSLGAAMATLVSFYLAGQPFERIRKPVKAVTFSSPLVGCEEFRAAFQTMEKAGLLHHLRVANQEDFVVGGWPCSLSLPVKQFKHVGINLELDDNEFKYLYSTKENGEERVDQVSFLRKFSQLFKTEPFNPTGYALGHHGEEEIAMRMLKMTYGEKDPVSALHELDKGDFAMASALEKIPYDRKNKFTQIKISDLYNDETLHGGFPFALKMHDDA